MWLARIAIGVMSLVIAVQMALLNDLGNHDPSPFVFSKTQNSKTLTILLLNSTRGSLLDFLHKSITPKFLIHDNLQQLLPSTLQLSSWVSTRLWCWERFLRSEVSRYCHTTFGLRFEGGGWLVNKEQRVQCTHVVYINSHCALHILLFRQVCTYCKTCKLLILPAGQREG
jgi:hypothetical protein